MRKKSLVAEFRAETKKLEEQRADLAEKMEEIIGKAKEEERAMTEDEQSEFDNVEKQIQAIDKTIEAEKRAQKLSCVNVLTNQEKDKLTEEERAAEQVTAEERAFVAFIRDNQEEVRSGEIQLTQGNNGVIVPTTIAKKIIKEVKDMVPYLSLGDVITTNGKVSVPVYGEDSTNHINADYVDEGTDLTDNVGKFKSVDLNGYVLGALALVSNKLVNNTDIEIINFIVNRVAEAMAEKLEEQFTIGNTKIKGVLEAKTVKTAAAQNAVTYDELVTLKHSIKQRFRSKAVWLMNPETWTAICKLKDGNGQPYFKEDSYTIFGNKVYESDSMPTMAKGKKAIAFGDLSGYTIKATKSVEIQILREKFATKNMLGVLAFGEYDANITDEKKITVLQMAAE